MAASCKKGFLRTSASSHHSCKGNFVCKHKRPPFTQKLVHARTRRPLAQPGSEHIMAWGWGTLVLEHWGTPQEPSGNYPDPIDIWGRHLKDPVQLTKVAVIITYRYNLNMEKGDQNPFTCRSLKK